MEHGASRTAGFPLHQCLTHSLAIGVGAASPEELTIGLELTV